MARSTGAVCRKCRREGVKLFLKGARCNTANCALDKRKTAPGQHGAKKGKLTDYGTHLREKQKVKSYYGVLEKQFRKYYQMAERAKGNTGSVLMTLLERRLDNIVYRAGFATSRAAARQIVAHGHIQVNGRRVDVASYLVKNGDEISVKNREASIKLVKNCIEANANVGSTDVAAPDFISVSDKTAAVPSARVMRVPTIDDVSCNFINAQLIVELCSK